MQVLLMAMLLIHIARSTPIHPAIKRKLRNSAMQKVTESATLPTAILDDTSPTAIQGGKLALSLSLLSLPTSVTYTEHSALSNDQSRIQTSLQTNKASSDSGNIIYYQQNLNQVDFENTVELQANDNFRKKFKCDYPECKFSTEHKSNIKKHKRIHN